MPSPFKSLLAPHKALKPTKDDDQSSPSSPDNQDSSTSQTKKKSIFVSQPLFKKKKSDKFSDIPFVEKPLHSKKPKENTESQKLKRPFLFPEASGKEKTDSFFMRASNALREKVHQADSALKRQAQERKEKREEKQKIAQNRKQEKTQSKRKKETSPTHSVENEIAKSQFQRLNEIYCEIYQEHNVLISYEQARKNDGKKEWEKRAGL